MAFNAEIQGHLDRKGKTYSTGTGAATFPTQTLSQIEIEELLRVANLQKYDVVLTAGVLTLQKR